MSANRNNNNSNNNHQPNQLGQPQAYQKGPIRKQNAICVTFTPDSFDNTSTINTSVQTQSCQPQMLNKQAGRETACRSASSSPWVARRVMNKPEDKRDSSGITFSLNVPTNSANRKLSLQPVVGQKLPQPQQQQTNAANDYLTGPPYQQQGPFSGNVAYNQSTGAGGNGNGGGGGGGGGGVLTNLAANNNNNNINNNNNLAVNNQHLAARKSIIGRLERTSFQTQRLSDVGVAVGQQITAKMGLKIPASQERIVEQTRWLYLRYVFMKLRQNRLPLRDLNLSKSSRARRAAALGDPPKISCSAPTSAAIILEPLSKGSFVSSNRKPSSRKRATLIGDDIASNDLRILAAKTNVYNLTSEQKSSGGDTLISSSLHTATNSTNLGNKKYIMDPAINNQILTVILDIIREFRELKPEFYGDTIYELIGIDKFTSIQTLLDVQMTICQEMTRSEISWCRISALFSLFGAMSLDCVQLGAPEHVGPILDGFIEFVERDLAFWISQQGGWESFLYKYRAGYQLRHLTTKMIIVTLPLLAWAFCSLFR